LLIVALADPHGLVRRLLVVTAAEALLGLTTEFMVFMRTDLYFVIQDLIGCANLYADSAAYLRYRVSPRGGQRPDPNLGYPPRQRRAVRWFTVVLLGGTATCLSVEFAVSVPALIVLVAHAISETVRGDPLVRLDGAVALAVLASWQILWVSRWWHQHGPQVHAYLSGRR
jgi:hypothetical protein